MAEIVHLNCLRIETPIRENVCGHCLLIKENDRLILVDTGLGLEDTRRPFERIGEELVTIVGYRFDERLTAYQQISALGLDPDRVTDCILSHFDNDHLGGVADFPQAAIHVSKEEYDSFQSGHPRYLALPLAHHPIIHTYSTNTGIWEGFDLRKIETHTEVEIFLVPLFGHTLGHCGVLIKNGLETVFYVGDAYYLRLELEDSAHPVNELARMRAEDNSLRLASLEQIRQLSKRNREVLMFGYHDIDEFLNLPG